MIHARAPLVLFFSFALGALFAAEPAGDLVTRKITSAAVPRTNITPTIDGDLSDACWRQAREISGFRLTAGDRKQPVRYATTARMLFDDTHLYIAFDCAEPDPAGLKTIAKQHDDPAMEFDDRVEVFLDLDHDHRHYWELAVNPAGVQFDQAAFYRLHGSRTCDFFPERNLFWRAKTKIGADRWTVEIAIDVTSLGLARLEEGTTWGVNLARARRPSVNPGDELWNRQPGEGAEYSAWIPVQDYIVETISNFHAPLEFGDVVLGDPGVVVEELRLPSASFTFGPIGRATRFGWNPLELKLHRDANSPRELTFALEVRTPDGAVTWKERGPVAFQPEGTATLRYWVNHDGENTIDLTLLDASSGRQLYRTCYVETAPPLVEFDLTSLYARRPSVTQPLTFRVLTDPATLASAELQLSLRSQANGRELAKTSIRDLKSADRATPVFDIEKLRALPGGGYAIAARLTDRKSDRVLGEVRQVFTKFALEPPREFSAKRILHSYAGVSADAIRVEFPFAAQFVFWRGANYVPWWEMDQLVMSNEFVEAWGDGGQGCNEPMQDRECRYSRVELLESSVARAVVHWRYALNDAHYRIYQNEWVDEYYTFYPDGVGTRRVELWANSATQHEMFEALLVKPPGARTAQLFEPEFATLANLHGDRFSMPMFAQDRSRYQQLLKSGKDFVVEFAFKDRLHPFTVFSLRDDLMPGVTAGMVGVGRALFQNSDQRGHWPLAKYPIDGYNAVGLDVPTHFSFGNIHTSVEPQRQPNRWIFLIGAAEPGSGAPEAHAKAWLYPAQVTVLNGSAEDRGYDFAERAYRLAPAKGAKRVDVRLTPKDGDLVHPAFLLESGELSDVRVSVNGEPLAAGISRVGKTAAGATVVFLNATFQHDTTFTFEWQ